MAIDYEEIQKFIKITKVEKMEYKYIRAWGIMLGSLPYYINAQIAMAQKKGAPATATYRDSVGQWHTLENCKSKETVDRLHEIVRRMESEE